MNAVNAVQLFTLVWTFTAVCQADDDISVSCENVTGTVGEEVTLTCSVSLEKSGCCIRVYKFQYPEKYNDSEIFRKEFPQDSCEQRNSFTCSFSSTTVMTGEFRFFVQATCGSKITEFTVNITEPNNRGVSGSRTGDNHGLEEDPPSNNFVIAVVVGCFIVILIIVIIIIMTNIYKTKLNYRQPCIAKEDMMTRATVQKMRSDSAE
ncbi:hypothetical protein PO909_012421 [Leuciscus waleckii]